MQSIMVTFKFYSRGTPLNDKVLTLDSSKTWGEELKQYFPDGKNNFVRRLAKKEQHSFGEKISILTNEYHQVRKLFAVEILKNGKKRKYGKKLRKSGRKPRATDNDDDSNNSSSSLTVKAPENGKKMTDRSLQNEKRNIIFPEDDYSPQIKQNFDTDSVCTALSQGSQEELDFQGIPNREIKPRVFHKFFVLCNARFLAVENEVKKLKRNDPNRWAKAGNILPISLTFLDLLISSLMMMTKGV